MVVIGLTIAMMMTISTMMMINAPSSKRSVTTPFQGVDASSSLAGVTIWPHRLRWLGYEPLTLKKTGRHCLGSPFFLYINVGKAERRLALRTDEDFRKNLTFQKIFDIIYIQKLRKLNFLSGFDKSPPANSPGNHDFD